MKAAICSAASGDHLRLLDISEPTLQRYADIHELDLRLTRYSAPQERPTSWYKLRLLLDLFDEGYEAAMWIDADALIIRYDWNIFQQHARSSLWMVLHNDPDSNPRPNCGVLVAWNELRVRRFLEKAWEQTQYLTHPWWEQAAMLDLLGWELGNGWAKPGLPTEWSDLVGWLGTEWNSMPQDPHPYPIIKHWPGTPFMTRLEEMSREANASFIRP